MLKWLNYSSFLTPGIFSHLSSLRYINVKQHSDKKPLEGYDKDSNMCITGFQFINE